MREQFERILAHVTKGWGPLMCRDLGTVMNAVNEAAMECSKSEHFQNAVGALFVKGVREIDTVHPLDGHISLNDVTAIFQKHIDLGTVLYVLKAAWSHHLDDDDCEGSEDDYHEHKYPGRLHLFDEYDKARTFAAEILETVVDSCPAQATNARVVVDMIDGNESVGLGQWIWDKRHSNTIWEPAKRN